MPREARILVKAGLLYLALTFALGGVLFVFLAWQRVRGPRHPAPGVH